MLGMLIVGQNYELQTLINSCVYEARRLSLDELKQHTKRGEIDSGNYLQITEGIIQRLEGQIRQYSAVKGRCSQKLLDSCRCLYNHALKKENISYLYTYGTRQPSIDQYLQALNEDNTDHKCHWGRFCPGLSEVSNHLIELKRRLETLP